MSDPTDAAKRSRRRRRWIVACALPAYFAFVAFGLLALSQESGIYPSDALLFLIVPFGVLSVLCWGLAPFFVLIALVLLIRDPWRRDRPRRERVGLTLLVLASPVAWFLANGISDSYHLLR